MKKKLKIKKIISFLLAVCMMLQLIPQSAMQISADGVTEIDLSTATVNNIYLLTSDQCVKTENDGVETSYGEYRLMDTADTSAAKNVYIGDRTYGDKEYTGTKSIKVELKNIKNSLSLLQINAISNGNYAANLNVTGASKIGKLDIQENADVNITLDADLEISEISMDKGSKLNVNTQGHKFKVTGTTQGSGDITFTGSNIDISGLKTKTLTLNNAKVTANDKKITATDQLTVKSSSVENASLLGYDADETGEKTLSFEGSGNKLTGVAAVGTSASGKATVTIDGQDTITESSNTIYYCDYSLTYKYNDTTLTPEQTWPVSYRVKFQGSMADNDSTITGYHTQSGNYTTGNTIKLPEYTTEGYSYVGWKTTSSTDTITTLPQNSKKNETLTAVLKSDNVVVSFDLGYEPNQSTNDDYKTLDKVSTKDQVWGDTVSLKTPSRFGYTFTGWKITSISNGKTYSKDETSYTVDFNDAKKSNDGEYQITLEAQWEAKTFPLRFLISSGVDIDKLQIKVGDETYDSITAFTKKYGNVTWNEESKYLQFDDISYGETLKNYLKKIGLSDIPQLIDQRTGEQKLDFSGWSTPGGSIVAEDMSFEIGGILDNKSEKENLADYEAEIIRTPTLLTSQWGTASYTLTTDIADGWEILVDGKVQEASVLTKLQNALTGKNTMSIKVKAGSEVTWRCSSSDVQNFSLWNFTDGFLPEETTMTSGAKYVSYTATMPYKDITATKSELENTYIDINQSSIRFEENVKLPSGRTVDGFWYDEKMTADDFDDMNVNAMTPAFQAESSDTKHAGKYFYIWDSKDTFHMTSCNKKTQNQLTLVNTTNIKLKDCKLEATDAYKTDAQGRKLKGIVLEGKIGGDLQKELADIDLRQYGNIILDVESHGKYTTKIETEGENAAGVIVQSHFDGNNTYNGTLNVNGTTGKSKDKLMISGTLLNEEFSFTGVTLLEDQDVLSDYLIYCSAINEGVGKINLYGSDIEAKDKRIHTGRGHLITSNKGNENCSINIGGARTYSPSYLYGSTYIRCYGDWIGAYNTFCMYENSNVVIDGNLVTTYSHWTAGASVDTSGYLVIKGNRAELENLTLTRGTVIANAAVIGRSCNIKGGLLITNQLMNNPVGYAAVDNKDGSYVYNGTGDCSKVDDNYPFVTLSQSNRRNGEFIFSGTSKTYLLGYYKTSSNRVYDTSVNATDDSNPVSKVIKEVIADDGNLKESPTLSDTELQNMVKQSNYTKNECVLFGNSSYNTADRMRSVNISGGKIYAAGNLTFFNDTDITSGSVYCNGNLSSKRDLSISGNANVTATEVGNNYNLTVKDSSDITRWQKTMISGGTITTDRVGTASSSYGSDSSDDVSRSTLGISGNPTIKERTSGKTTEYATDVYINYLADKNSFTFDDDLPNNVHYTGTDYQNLKMAEAVSIKSPTLNTGTGTAAWILDSMTGEGVDTINKDGTFSLNNNVLEDKNAYKERDNISLYAVKGTYDLSVADGKDNISKIQVGDTQYKNFDSSISADRGAEVTVTLNDTSMADKSVIWYQDATGKFYNVNPEKTTKNGQTILTFTMPAASVQIYVTNEMKLYLNRYEISITKDGFRTQYDAEEESSFKYAGDLVITQDNLDKTLLVDGGYIGVNGILTGATSASSSQLTSGATKNRLHIESVNEKRNITLNKIIMDGAMDEDKIIVDENCGDVELQIDGAVRLLSTYLHTGSNLTLKGKNQKTAGAVDQDIVQFDAGNAGTSNSTGFINNGEDKTGNVTFDSLNIIRTSKYYSGNLSGRRPLVYSVGKVKSDTVKFKNCNMEALVESSMTMINNYENVTIEDSNFDIETKTAWNSVVFNSCSNVNIKGGSFTYTCGATYDTYPLYYGVSNFSIDGAKVNLNNRNSENGSSYRMIQPDNAISSTFTVKNAGELNVDHRIKLKKLALTSGGMINVGQQDENGNYDGSLLCKDITVESGEIHTGRLLISGYYSAPNKDADYLSKTEIVNQMKAGNNLVKDGTLTLKNGTIEASEEIGGALGGTIRVEGGQIKSPMIGSCDKVYGYGEYLPTAAENEWIYSISKIPSSLTVNVNGGTVNVPSDGYLGGMNSSVNISGGKINLQGNAILGMTQAQKKELSDDYSSKGDDIANHKDTNCLVTISGGNIEKEDSSSASGSIQAPYGSVKISGTDTKIKVANIQSEYGNIEIKEAQKGYKNPYTGGENGQYKSDNIGILVTDTLSAQTIEISEGAQVYAENAFAQITNNEGKLSVKEAALYSASYGEKGIVRDSSEKEYDDNPISNDQTVFGTKMVTVSYDLNPNGVILDSDLADIQNPNRENYTVTGDESTITLEKLESDGYEFKGWYRNKECSGNAVTTLKTSVQDDLTLYAKWEKVKVKFKIIMDSKSSTDVNASEFEGDTNWTKEGDAYVYADRPEITYGDKILSVNGVNLKNYSTNTLGVTEIAISESGYTGDTYINAETIVTKQLAKYYKTKNEPIVLHINGVQKRYATVTFSLNKKDGKPSDAAFNGTIGASSSMERQENVGVDKSLGTVTSFADSSITDGKSKGLIQPSATGYTFIGWNTNADATKDTDTGWVDKDSIFKDNTRVYAIWQANTYRIAFDAGEGTWVTSKKNAPAVNETPNQTLYYYWKYDTPISETDSFWIKQQGTNEYMSELPYAWKDGSTFDNAKGWTYTYSVNGQEFTDTVTSTEVLNSTFIKKLNISFGNPDGNPTTTALTLKASYTPVKVTYDLNNGKWKDSEDKIVTNPNYEDALYGYTKGNGSDTENGSKVVSTVTGENSQTYQVLSTTAKYYNTNKTYSANDYRNKLSRKGYTFEGWEDEDGKPVGTTPRFRNVKLKAKWKANSYSLTLNSLKDDVDSSYSKFHTGSVSSPIKDINVTVGEEINDSKWPARNGDWYAYNKGNTGNLEDNQKRYLLGFTFATLDPGTTNESESAEGYKVYQKYAQTVTNLQNNSKSLFQSSVTTTDSTTEGTVFALPEDSTYTSDIGESSTNYTIPDYPDGSTIDMYAVYRERSLVFVERYIDPNGNVQQKIKYSTAWNEYSNYPTTYGKSGNSDITKDGYSLVGWYVNGFTRSSPAYPDNKSSYEASMNQFKETAANLGTYDIMVYTVYVAQLTRSDITLTAQQDPTSDQLSTNSYVLPSSMQTGKLSLRLNSKDDGLNIISQAEMKNHEYDQTWTSNGKTYQSDDTTAIVVSIHKGDKTVTKDLSELVDVDGNVSLNQQVEAGWQLTFTLYHSKVMTKQSTYKLEVQANFEGLEDQWIKNQIQVKLQPSMYKVKYKINLPEQAGKLTIDDSNADFTKPADDKTEIVKEVSLAYGSTLSSKIPEIEGYKDSTQGWKYGTLSDVYQKLDMAVNAANNGMIDLTKDYEAKTYTLAADDQTLNDWTITYTDGVTGAAEKPLGNDAKEVSYHSKITFKPKDSKNPPEFITLTLGSGEEKKVKLSDYATEQSDGSYTFAMPAEDVRASFVTEETMYLEEGTITINDNGYTQEKATETVTKSWPGNYIILQNKENSAKNPTKNRLIINGDQSSHKIEIGNLNINSTNSIELGNNTTATITMGDQKAVSGLTAKNIKVPATSSFTCKPEQPDAGEQNAIIALDPENQAAAIGDVSGNGSITLDHLKIAAIMPAGSTASAIGSGKTAQTAGKDINVTNSDFTVTEQSDTDTYNGIWIGGNSVTAVNIENAVINRGNEKNMRGPLITNAENVKIVSSKIGTSDQQIPDPIYANSKLVIDSSEIYQNIITKITENTIGTAPIGTAEAGGTEITKSTINMRRSGGISEIKDLYTGSMYIKDAASDVTIDGSQIIDMSNGSIDIKTTAYKQGDTDHQAKQERKNYVLLEEGTKPQSAPDLVVSSIAENSTIEVRKPSGKYGNQQDSVIAGDFQTATNTKLVLKGNLEISGKAEITDTSGKTVKVTADDNATFKMSGTESVFANSKGTYTQSGGKLESESTFGNKDLDITLDGVTATLQKSLHAKDLNIESSNVTAAEQVGSKPESTANASNVTNVKINKSTVTAKEIGALGQYDKTFTIVTADTASSLNGTIIKDEYRLAYDDNSAELGTTNLSKVLRTSTASGSTTVQPENGVPGNPTDPNSLFSVWYVNEKDSGQTVRKALKTGSDTIPGLTHNTTLSASTPDKVITDDVKTNGDKTKTLTVHAWRKATGEVVIEKGRKFVTTTTKDQKTTTQANGAWTLQLTSSGTFIDGRDYQVTFGKALPQGTKLTLTIPKTGQSAGEYYYYDVNNATTSSVKFSQFMKMGTDDTFKAKTYKADAIPDEETYLLSADFAQTDHKTTGENQVTLKLLPEKTSTEGIAMGTGVSYDLSSVTKAVLNVEGNKVTISTFPTDEDNLSGQQLYVKAVFTKNNSTNDKAKIPYNITASLGDINGKWISRDTVIFDLGTYGSVQEFSQNYKFAGLTLSDYKITWSLVYGEKDENNIAGNVISNKVE